MLPEALLSYIKAEPFRPFRIQMNSGRTFDIRHPEMIRVTSRDVVIFTSVDDNPDIYDRWFSIGYGLIETVSHLDAPVA